LRTVEKLGGEYRVSGKTVKKYGSYARAIDKLSQKEPELISNILTGEVKISQDDIRALSKRYSATINDVKNKLKNKENNFINYSNIRKVIPPQKEKITVKDMPAYDPDAEISSLTLTIPSWISSIERTKLVYIQPIKNEVCRCLLINQMYETSKIKELQPIPFHKLKQSECEFSFFRC
jgi:hypothetical protein